MLDDKGLSRLLLEMYGCVLRPDAWPAFLDHLCTTLSVPAAAFTYHAVDDAKGNAGAAHGLDPAALEEYSRTFGSLDPWTQAMRAKGRFRPGSVEVVRGQDLVPWSQFVTTEYYSGFAKRYDYVDTTAVATVDAEGDSTTNITLPRGARQRRHDRELLAALRLIGPHLQQAMSIQHRLAHARREREGLHVLTDHLEPTLVLAGDGHVQFVNAAAEALLSRRPELSVERGRLRCWRASLQQHVDTAIRDALGLYDGRVARPASVRVTPQKHPRPLTLVVSPALATDGEAMASVLVREAPQPPLLDGAVIQQALGLTPTEARIAVALASGEAVASIAARIRARPDTVRWHLKRIYSKTDTGTQARLVGLVHQVCGTHVGPTSLLRR